MTKTIEVTKEFGEGLQAYKPLVIYRITKKNGRTTRTVRALMERPETEQRAEEIRREFEASFRDAVRKYQADVEIM